MVRQGQDAEEPSEAEAEALSCLRKLKQTFCSRKLKQTVKDPLNCEDL